MEHVKEQWKSSPLRFLLTDNILCPQPSLKLFLRSTACYECLCLEGIILIDKTKNKYCRDRCYEYTQDSKMVVTIIIIIIIIFFFPQIRLLSSRRITHLVLWLSRKQSQNKHKKEYVHWMHTDRWLHCCTKVSFWACNGYLAEWFLGYKGFLERD